MFFRNRSPEGDGNAPKTSLRRAPGGLCSRSLGLIVLVFLGGARWRDDAVLAEVVRELDEPQPRWAGTKNPGRHDHERLDQDQACRAVHSLEGSAANHRD